MRTITFLIFFAIAIFYASGLKLVSRSLTTESVQLQLEYLGSCDHFKLYDAVSVQFSRPTTTCLPILNNVSDNANLQADYFCSDIGPNRSIIHFVEVYVTSDQITESSFIFSFLPSRPFRAHVPVGSIAYSRRPDCTVRQTFCDRTFFVDSCRQNQLTFKKKYVLNSDRVYVAVNANLGDTCKNILTCCSYISNVTPGICPSTTPTSLNSFPKKPKAKPENHYQDKDDHKDKHENNGYDDHEDEHDNDRNGYDDDRRDNYKNGKNRKGNNDRHGDKSHNNVHKNKNNDKKVFQQKDSEDNKRNEDNEEEQDKKRSIH